VRRESIDLNADIGEGCGSDDQLVPLVSSVNIACGAHAGDDDTMRGAVALALRHGAAIGAHPGFADRENFGRRELPINPVAAAGLVVAQTRILRDIAWALGARLGHVKLHGALYNMAARDAALAEAVVDALVAETREPGRALILVTLAGSTMEAIARKRGLRVLGEAFADRTYRRNGSLMPRSQPGAVISDAAAAARQALRIAAQGVVRCEDGTDIAVDAGTVCLHGDGPSAVEFARAIRRDLSLEGIAVRSPAP
jgi:UPF0271 protein